MTQLVHPFVPGNIWLLRHCCFNNQAFFYNRVERRRYLYWLFQARRRFGLSILNYSVHINEVHLMCMDKGRGEIPCSMHMLAEAMADDLNTRKQTTGQVWENHYQAAVITSTHEIPQALARMDLSTVNAGYVNHPIHWRHSGYFEVQNPPARARRIDFNAMQRLLHPLDFKHLQTLRRTWAERQLIRDDVNPGGNTTLHGTMAKSCQTPFTVNRAYRTSSAMLLPAKQAVPALVPKRFNT